jgi:hypothetical protein
VERKGGQEEKEREKEKEKENVKGRSVDGGMVKEWEKEKVSHHNEENEVNEVGRLMEEERERRGGGQEEDEERDNQRG